MQILHSIKEARRKSGFYKSFSSSIATCDSEVAEYKQREELRDLEHTTTIENKNDFDMLFSFNAHVS